MKLLFSNAFRRYRLYAFASSFLFYCALLSAAPAQVPTSAQRIPAADSKLIEIKVNGSKRFTPQEVAAASGLQIGTIVDDEVFRKAARQLGETGAFDGISYSFTYSAAGTKVVFQVTDADKFVPAHFSDFVWFTDQELLEKVHERAPLFDGDLPTNGRLPDQVSDILQALLVENGVPGHVQYLRTPAPKGQLASIDYAVADVTIRVHQIVFTGVEADELPELEAAAEKLSGRDYYRGLINQFVERAVLPAYRERGYLKASCTPSQPNVVKGTASASASDPINDKQAVTLVDVTIPVTSGMRYKLSGWNWSGNKNIPTDDLQPLVHAKIGQPANTVQLEDNLRAVQQLYGSHGYVTATIKANAEYDDAGGTVAYQLVVTEGALYHMGELEFRGIDNQLTSRLRAAWRIRPGDVYDSTYLKEFLPLARKLLPRTMDWDVMPHVTAIAKDRTVDVDLQYTAKAPQ
ncbi:MAG: POTRA domain-containing protein [Candidatus Sulfotelmatobacter sp.]